MLKRLGATTSPSLVLKSPFGNANNASDLFVADTYDHRVVAVSKSTGRTVWSTSTTCPSPGGKALLRIRDVTVGSDGNVYAADTDNNRIVEFNPTTRRVRRHRLGGRDRSHAASAPGARE